MGPQGERGEQGPPGVSGYEIVGGESAADASAHKIATVNCPAGKHILGGGGQAFASLGDPNRDRAPLVIRHSQPISGGGPDGWYIIADAFAPYNQNWVVRVYAICANVES